MAVRPDCARWSAKRTRHPGRAARAIRDLARNRTGCRWIPDCLRPASACCAISLSRSVSATLGWARPGSELVCGRGRCCCRKTSASATRIALGTSAFSSQALFGTLRAKSCNVRSSCSILRARASTTASLSSVLACRGRDKSQRGRRGRDGCALCGGWQLETRAD